VSNKLYLACLLIITGHVVAWYGTYSQFIWGWCKDNTRYLPLIFALPTAYFFLYGMKFAVQEMGEVWGPRLLGFGLSYLIFPVLTYYYFGENMFEPKTLTCIFLSFTIVLIQIFWK
tara:strand:- start:4425 stop:4772 length:348 start_codon:yes stop_codon:yes gene_type:complete